MDKKDDTLNIADEILETYRQEGYAQGFRAAMQKVAKKISESQKEEVKKEK